MHQIFYFFTSLYVYLFYLKGKFVIANNNFFFCYNKYVIEIQLVYEKIEIN